MKQGYWVVQYRSVSDMTALSAYKEKAIPAIEGAGGRFLVRGVPAVTKEVGLQELTAVIVFTDLAAAKAAYDTDAYREARALLGAGAERDFRIIEALDE